MDKEPVQTVWRRWKRSQKGEDFDYLYQQHEEVLERLISRYPDHIQTEVFPRLLGLYVEALHTYNPGDAFYLSQWVYACCARVHRLAYQFMHPGVPEHKRRLMARSS